MDETISKNSKLNILEENQSFQSLGTDLLLKFAGTASAPIVDGSLQHDIYIYEDLSW